MKERYWVREQGHLAYLDRLLSLCGEEGLSNGERLRFFHLFSRNLEDYLSHRRQKLLALGRDCTELDQEVRRLFSRRDRLAEEMERLLPPQEAGGSWRLFDGRADWGTDGGLYGLMLFYEQEGNTGAALFVGDRPAQSAREEAKKLLPPGSRLMGVLPAALLPGGYLRPDTALSPELQARQTAQGRREAAVALFLCGPLGDAPGICRQMAEGFCRRYFPKALFLNARPLLSARMAGNGPERRFTRLVPVSLRAEGGLLPRLCREELLLCHPFDSLAPLHLLLREAACSPQCRGISLSLYRVATPSATVALLCRAAEQGKEVRVFLEPRARGDEEQNLECARRLFRSGCQVYFGRGDRKVHGKLLCLELANGGTITQVSTGNPHEGTARSYVDLRLFTPDPAAGRDALALFAALERGEEPPPGEFLHFSPGGIEPFLFKKIRQQQALGSRGYLFFKCNALTSRSLCAALEQAAGQGVTVDLLVRGACVLHPRKTGPEGGCIRVRSAVGKLLQHDRIYQFGRGQEAEYYLSSADLMARSLRRRVEAACPVQGETAKEKLRRHLSLALENASVFEADEAGRYRRSSPPRFPAEKRGTILQGKD